jgi:hypothetical protein
MLLRGTCTLCLMAIASIHAFAAKPVGTLSSAGPVIVSGTEMSAASVVFWPVANHDEISTLDSRAILILPDQSRITLRPHSTAKVESDRGSVKVTFLAGSGAYDLASPASATLAGGRLVSSSATQGRLVGSQDASSRRHPVDNGNDQEDKHKKHLHPSPIE